MQRKYNLLLDKVKADSFLISHLLNIRYLTGFRGTMAYLLITPKASYLITDSRYVEYAQKNIKGVKVCLLKESLIALVKDILKKDGVRSLAYEYSTVSHIFYNRVIRQISPGKIVPANMIIESLRMLKAEGEIRSIRKACQVVLSSVEEVMKNKKKYRGYTEKALADELDFLFRKKGATASAFPAIVAEGRHASQPHHHSMPGKKIAFSPLLIDAGAVVEDYNSDLTRTSSHSKISKQFQIIFQIVQEAQEAAIAMIRPGIPAYKVDQAARDIIVQAGYGEFFGHGLGHGIGLEVHEKPIISRKSRTILQPGMVFTVEPGIYIPERFGCRIEDVVVVTDNGYKLLTK